MAPDSSPSASSARAETRIDATALTPLLRERGSDCPAPEDAGTTYSRSSSPFGEGVLITSQLIQDSDSDDGIQQEVWGELEWVPGWHVVQLDLPTLNWWQELRPWVICWLLASCVSGGLAIATAMVTVFSGGWNYLGVFGLTGSVIAFIAACVYLCRPAAKMAPIARTVSSLAFAAYRLQLLSALLALLDGVLWICFDVDAGACALGAPSPDGAPAGGSFYCVMARLPLAVSTLAAVAMTFNGWIGLKLAARMRETAAAWEGPAEVAAR